MAPTAILVWEPQATPTTSGWKPYIKETRPQLTSQFRTVHVAEGCPLIFGSLREHEQTTTTLEQQLLQLEQLLQ